MLDELMDMFDRDKRQGTGHSGRKRGMRGMLGRLLGDDADDQGRDRPDRDDDTGHRPGDRRSRQHDAFDFDE